MISCSLREARTSSRRSPRSCAMRHGRSVTVIASDLSRPEAPEEIVRSVAEAGITVDVLVNNAGFANYGPFHENDRRGELDMIQVNVTALTHLTHLLLPGMVERGSGRVMNVASTAAFQPGPLMAGYFRHQGLRPSLLRGHRDRARGHRRDGHRSLSRSHHLRLPGAGRNGELETVEARDDDLPGGCRVRLPRAHARQARGHSGLLEPFRNAGHPSSASKDRCEGRRKPSILRVARAHAPIPRRLQPRGRYPRRCGPQRVERGCGPCLSAPPDR